MTYEQMKDFGKSGGETSSVSHGRFDPYDYEDFKQKKIETTTSEEWLYKDAEKKKYLVKAFMYLMTISILIIIRTSYQTR